MNAQQACEEREEYFRVLVENSGDTIMLLAVDGARLYVSPTSSRVLGYPPQELLGHSGDDLLHPDDATATWAELDKLLDDSSYTAHIEFRLRQPGGTWRWIEATGRNLLGKWPVDAILVNMRDVADKKAAQEELRRKERQLREAEQAAHFGSWEWDLEKDATFWSDELYHILDLSRDSLAKSAAEAFLGRVHPDDRQNVIDAGNKAIADHAPLQLEYRIIRGNGEERTIYAKGKVVADPEGRAVRIVGTAEDVTERRNVERARTASEHRYRTLMEQAADAIFLIDQESRIEDANATAVSLLGFSKEELKSRRFLDLCASPSAWPDFERLKRDGVRLTETVLVGKDGIGRLVEINAKVLEGLTIQVIARDISVRKHYERARNLALRVYESSHQAIVVMDDKFQVISVNPAFTETTGYHLRDVVGQTPESFHTGNSARSYHEVMSTLIKGDYWTGEFLDRRKNGELYPTWMSVGPVRDEEGHIVNYVAIFSDISERKAYQARIEYLLHHDSLTGLANRTLLRYRFEQLLPGLTRGQELSALLYLDVDQFRLINDSLGHDVGDSVLKEVAARIRKRVGETAIVGRYGSDEFVVILPAVRHFEEVGIFVEELLATLSEEYRVDGEQLTITFSVGIGLYPNDGRSFQMLLRNANTALHSAKKEGRNTYRFFREEMNVQARERMSLYGGLRRALSADEFVLFFQPQIALCDGSIVGGEALLRWNRPGYGIVTSEDFIQFAEESGLVADLGEWALRAAFRQITDWAQRELPRVDVAINVSAQQLQREGLIKIMTGLLSEFPLVRNWVEIEITESSLLVESPRVLDTLRGVRDMGVKVSLDDFGVGYSNLAYLKSFTADKLKIDKSFIHDLGLQEKNDHLVHAIIDLGRHLKMWVIAEGVESEMQMELLRTYGCDGVQGFYVAEPVSADAFEKLLASGRVRTMR